MTTDVEIFQTVAQMPEALKQELLHYAKYLMAHYSAMEEEARHLVLEKQAMVQQRLKTRFQQVPQERSLADELIAERQEAAQKEVAE